MGKITSQITSVTLQGFQTIAERTEIPLSGLVLAYGPNSAGKSAVADALDLVVSIFGRGWGAPDHEPSTRLSTDIGKNWRRLSADKHSLGFADRMVVGAKFRMGPFGGVNMPEGGQRSERKIHKFKEVEWEATFRDPSFDIEFYKDGEFELPADGDPEFTSCFRDLKLAVDGQEFAKVDDDYDSEYLSVNVRHAMFCNSAVIGPKIFEVWPQALSEVDCWITIPNKSKCLRANKTIDDLPAIESIEEENEQERYLFGELIAAYNTVVNQAAQIITGRDNFVDASRSIPAASDLSFLVRCDLEDNNDSLNRFNAKIDSDIQYRDLARSCASTIPGMWMNHSDHGGMLKKINGFLSDRLFRERGYQLKYDYALVLSSEVFAEVKEYPSKIPADALISIKLVDSKGVSLEFEDVGSGLGYSLPVLCALSRKEGQILIQQPELHLHPAMQGDMGDLLILSSKCNESIFVETHSEHLLLRLLRRVRESNNGKWKESDDLYLSSSDVTVLYFDSQIDGTTKVKRLRVSRGGEFMDRWPHGFFEERDRDLFDE